MDIRDRGKWITAELRDNAQEKVEPLLWLSQRFYDNYFGLYHILAKVIEIVRG